MVIFSWIFGWLRSHGSRGIQKRAHYHSIVLTIDPFLTVEMMTTYIHDSLGWFCLYLTNETSIPRLPWAGVGEDEAFTVRKKKQEHGGAKHLPAKIKPVNAPGLYSQTITSRYKHPDARPLWRVQWWIQGDSITLRFLGIYVSHIGWSFPSQVVHLKTSHHSSTWISRKSLGSQTIRNNKEKFRLGWRESSVGRIHHHCWAIYEVKWLDLLPSWSVVCNLRNQSWPKQKIQ